MSKNNKAIRLENEDVNENSQNLTNPRNSNKEMLSKAIKQMIDTEDIIKKEIPENYRKAIKEIYKHIHYVDKELNSENTFNSDIIINFIKNISSIGQTLLHLPSTNSKENFNIIHLGDHKILKKLDFAWLCVHGLNVDVAPGILRDNTIEPWNKNILEAILKPGNNFINIGANFGFFTLLAASLVGQTGNVIAFEANPTIYECLSYGIFYSGYPNIVNAHNIALSNKEDIVKLYYSPIFSGGGSIINNINYDGNPSMNTIQQCRIGKSHDTNKHLINGDWLKHSMINDYVKSDSLDNIIQKYYPDISHLKLIQIDVEGAEKLVLDGSMKTIKKFKPMILVEFDPHTVQDQVKEIDRASVYYTFEKLKSIGYSFFKVQTTLNFEFKLISIPSSLNQIPHCDIFCIPNDNKEMLDLIKII